ncbi:MAG TPA: transporter substrate-binding domain-containing protein [Telluria sp.]|nr:transporter substrate-binding domain-containing protein [Telluria sp.]
MRARALLLGAALLPAAAWAQLALPVKVYANWSQPPKSAIGEDGAVHGYAIDTARAVLREAQVEHVFVPLPYPRAFELTKACDGLMVGVFRSPEREAFLQFSQPIVPDHVALVSRAADPPLLHLPQDLAGRSLTYLSGAYTGIDLASFGGVRLEQQASFDIMLRKLAAHRTDAVVISPRQGVAIAAAKAGVPMSTLRIADQPLAVVSNYIVACKRDPALTKLMQRIDLAASQLRANGSFDRIMEHYQ